MFLWVIAKIPPRRPLTNGHGDTLKIAYVHLKMKAGAKTKMNRPFVVTISS